MVLVYCCVLTLPNERTGLSIFVFKYEKRLFFHRLMSQMGRAKRKFFSSMPKCTDSYHPAHAQSILPVLSNDSTSGQRRSSSAHADAQASLGLRCPHMPRKTHFRMARPNYGFVSPTRKCYV